MIGSRRYTCWKESLNSPGTRAEHGTGLREENAGKDGDTANKKVRSEALA